VFLDFHVHPLTFVLFGLEHGLDARKVCFGGRAASALRGRCRTRLAVSTPESLRSLFNVSPKRSLLVFSRR